MAPTRDFKHNHYVPEWYQRRFMLPGQGKYWYLDLKPEQVVQNGHRFTRRDLLHWGRVGVSLNTIFTPPGGVLK